MSIKQKIDLDKEVKVGGWILIGLGILHFILAGILWSVWGAIIIVLGIIALFYRSKNMLLVFGLSLILVGVLNLIGTSYSGVDGFWMILGVLQIYWGIQQIVKFGSVKENPKYNIKEKNKKTFVWYGLRYGFWTMIGLWIFSIIFESIIPIDSGFYMFLNIIWLISIIFTFVVSIIHLNEYRNKALAIISLVIASLLVLLTIIGFVYGAVMIMDEDFTNEYTFDINEVRKDFLIEDGYEVLSINTGSYSTEIAIQNGFTKDTSCYPYQGSLEIGGADICWSNYTQAYLEMKSLGNRNDQIWDGLSVFASAKDISIYRIDILSPTETCTYYLSGKTYGDYLNVNILNNYSEENIKLGRELVEKVDEEIEEFKSCY